MHLPAGADVTSDCKGAVARNRKGSHVKGRNLDNFGTAPTERVDLHWVPSHLTEKQFREQVGLTGAESSMTKWTDWLVPGHKN